MKRSILKSVGTMTLFMLLCLSGCSGDETTIIQSPPALNQLKIASVEPAENEDAAPDNSFIKIHIDGIVTNASLRAVSCSVRGENLPVPGTLTFFESSIIFVPEAPLNYGQLYTVTFLSSDSSFESRSWTFKVRDDPEPFTLGAVDFNSDPAKLGVLPVITVTFTLPLALDSFNPNDISLLDSWDQAVAISSYYDAAARKLSISPVSALEYAQDYSLHFSGRWLSTTGKVLSRQEPITFTTAPDSSAPRILWTSPVAGATAMPYNGQIVVRFSEPLDPATVKATLFAVNYSGWSEAIPFTLSYDQNLEVHLIPDAPMAFTANVRVEIAPGLRDRAGNAMTVPYSFTFTTSVDNVAPAVAAITPLDKASNVDPATAITLQFSELIDPDSVAEDLYLFLDNGSYYGLAVPSTVAVNGEFLSIVPKERLLNGTTYKIDLDSDYYKKILDRNGNRLSGGQEFTFTTAPLSTVINVGMAMNAFTYDAGKNLLYGVNNANRKLLVVDLATKALTTSIDLTYRAADLCLHTPSNRLFLVNENSSFITEIDLATNVVTNVISWSANRWGDGTTPTPFEIVCGAEKLYVVDGQWSPALWTINLAPPYATTEQGTVPDVGGLALSANESTLYSWYQYGWSAGSANSHVSRFDLTAGQFVFGEQSSTGYPQHNRDPLNAPIFYDEAGGRVINKQYIFNAHNLSQIINRFNDTDVIYGADFSRGRLASKKRIFSLTDFRTLRTVPIADPDDLFFDKDGNFYMIKNTKSAIYYLPEAEVSPD